MILVASAVQSPGEAVWCDGPLTQREFHPAVVGTPQTFLHEYSPKEKIRLLLSAPVRV